MRITEENSSVVLAWSYFHTCSSSSLAVIILKYFSCLAAGIAWTTWSATRLSPRMSSSSALMASSLLRGRHETIGCRLIGFFLPRLPCFNSVSMPGRRDVMQRSCSAITRRTSVQIRNKDKIQRGVGWTSTVHQRFSVFLFTFFFSSASLQTLKV